MKKKCPSCGTIVAVEPGAKPVCPNCGYGSPRDIRTPGSSADGQPRGKVFDGAALLAKVQEFDWRRLIFMDRAVAFVSQGRSFTQHAAKQMRFRAGLTVIGGVVASILVWIAGVNLFNSVVDWIVGIPGLLIVQVTLVLGTYMVAHLLVIRARHVEALPDEQFTIIPLTALKARVTGETLAALALPACVTIGFLVGTGAAGAIAGLGGVLVGTIVAVPVATAALHFFYFWAERFVVLAEIAKKTAATAANTEAIQRDLQAQSAPLSEEHMVA